MRSRRGSNTTLRMPAPINIEEVEEEEEEAEEEEEEEEASEL